MFVCPYLSSSIPKYLAYGVFVSQLMKYEDFLCRWSILVSNHWSWDILHGNSRLLWGNYMVIIHTLFTNLTLLWHICWRVYSPTVTFDWFAVILFKTWRVPHVGQEMLTHSGTPDCTPYGMFIISPIHYIYKMCQSKDYVYGLMTGLFAWISLDCLFVDSICLYMCLYSHILWQLRLSNIWYTIFGII